MSPTSAAWNDVADAVLAVFTNDLPRTTGDLWRALPAVPDSYIRAALHQLADLGYLAAARGVMHMTYTITEAGKRHLANTMEAA